MHSFSINEDIEQLLSDGLSRLQGFSFPEDPSSKILIIIDVPIPEAFPTHTNPDTIFALINLLKTKGYFNIQLIGLSEFPYSDSEIMKSFGLFSFINDIGAMVVPLDDETKWVPYPDPNSNEATGQEYKVPAILSESDTIIAVNQLKHNAYLGIYGVSEMLQKLISKASGNLEFRFDLLTNLLNGKNSAYINDAYYIGLGTTPFVSNTTKIEKTNTMIFATNPFLCDILTLHWLGAEKPVDVLENRLISNLRTYLPEDYSTEIPDEHKNSFKFDVKSEFKISGLKSVFPDGPSVYYGSGTVQTQYLLIKYLGIMESLMIKDMTHFNEYNKKGSILIGSEPPVPADGEKVLLFGQQAKNTTKDYEFRKKIKLKKVLTEKQLELKLFKFEMKADLKIENAKEKHNDKLLQIQEKQEEKEKENLIKKLNSKLEKNLAKIENWRERKKQKAIMKNEKRKAINLNPKIKINKNVVAH